MIYVKDGNIEVNGSKEELIKDWCILTDAIFKKMFKEDYADKMEEAVEFVLENSEAFSKMRED